MVDHRSVSQIKTYEDCAYRYYLERVEKAWQRPALWFPMGTAVHAAIEAYEKSGRTIPLDEAEEVFAESYAAEVTRYAEVTPNMEYWSSSGPYKAGDEWTDRRGRHYVSDAERRFKLGKEQVGRYYAYVAATQDVIWAAPDGTPGIELEFNAELDGVMMKGFIDLVKVDVLEDTKTGNEPGDAFQLKIYQMALKEMYGAEWKYGHYWMGKTGKPSPSVDLSAISDDEVYERIHKADDGIKAGDFPANPGDNCNRCSVNTSCPFSSL